MSLYSLCHFGSKSCHGIVIRLLVMSSFHKQPSAAIMKHDRSIYHDWLSYRVCSERSVFQFPEVRIGIIPGALGTQLLPRLTSFSTSLSMCVGCSKLTAKEALNAGIVDQIIPNAVRKATDSTEDTTESLVERMVKVLENQILRGEDAPNPFKRTR